MAVSFFCTISAKTDSQNLKDKTGWIIERDAN